MQRSSSLALVLAKRTNSKCRLFKFGIGSIFTIRDFHATPRRPFFDECLLQTHSFISGLHAFTGLPWAASIPLTAFVVRVLVVFPFDVYHRHLFNKKARLGPQLMEVYWDVEKKVTQANIGKTALEKRRLIDQEMNRTLGVIYKQNGVQVWKYGLVFARFPIWLVVMETLRRTAGVEEGLLGLVGKSLTGCGLESAVIPNMDVIQIEQSLGYEGMLWFPDLLLPDSILVLPFVLSAVSFGSLRFGTLGLVSTMGFTSTASTRFNLLLRRASYMLVLAAGPATLKFPSVMLLYWISSCLCSLGTKYTLSQLMPQVRIVHIKKTSDSKKQQYRASRMEELRPQKKKQQKKK